MAALPGDADLAGVVIDNTYYNLDAANGDQYDAADGCIVLSSTTSDADIQAIIGLPVGAPQVKDAFSGIIFMVQAGSGKVYVNAATFGSAGSYYAITYNTAQEGRGLGRGVGDAPMLGDSGGFVGEGKDPAGVLAHGGLPSPPGGQGRAGACCFSGRRRRAKPAADEAIVQQIDKIHNTGGEKCPILSKISAHFWAKSIARLIDF